MDQLSQFLDQTTLQDVLKVVSTATPGGAATAIVQLLVSKGYAQDAANQIAQLVQQTTQK